MRLGGGRGRARNKEQGPPSDKSLKSDVRRLTTQRAFSARQMLALTTIATGLVLSPHFTPLTRRCQSNASPHEPRARTRLSRNKGACVVPNIFGGKYQTFRKRDALTFRNVMGLQITLYRVRGPFAHACKFGCGVPNPLSVFNGDVCVAWRRRQRAGGDSQGAHICGGK